MFAQRSVFTHSRWAVQSALVLAIGSVVTYPGGTRLDHAAAGYSFSHNFLSDLGMTVAYSGRPNSLGALLFTLSMTIIVFGLGGTLVGFARLYSETPQARRLARAAAFAGLVVCGSLLGVALTPENRMLALHIQFTMLAFRVFPLVPVLLALASRYSTAVPRRMSRGWTTLTAVLVAYVVLIGWGPTTATPEGLVVQITAQKIVAMSLVVIFVYLSLEADRVLTSMQKCERTSVRTTSNKVDVAAD
jgi:hypothetical membrane protein